MKLREAVLVNRVNEVTQKWAKRSPLDLVGALHDEAGKTPQWADLLRKRADKVEYANADCAMAYGGEPGEMPKVVAEARMTRAMYEGAEALASAKQDRKADKKVSRHLRKAGL